MGDWIWRYAKLIANIPAAIASARLPNWARLVCVLLGIAIVCWFLLRQPELELPQLEAISPIDQIAFRSHWELRFPEFRRYFEKFAEEQDVDWRLLSVIGYQESKWLEDAVSPTGVRGIMMLTRRTAKEVGVADRTDPGESIAGGAQYLRYLLRRAPTDLDADEQTWFAVSAYNGGIGRLGKAYRKWRGSTTATASWREFESSMLNGNVDPLVRTAMLYTRRVRDYYHLADWITKTE